MERAAPNRPYPARLGPFLLCGGTMLLSHRAFLLLCAALTGCGTSHPIEDPPLPDAGIDPPADAGAVDPPPFATGCAVVLDEIVEPSIGGCHRASLALGTGDRPHVAWSGVDENGWNTEAGYSRRSDTGWETQRPFGTMRHVTLDVDGEDAFVLTVDTAARAALWGGATLTEVAAFDDGFRRGPSGDGLVVRDGVVHVLIGSIQLANSAGGEGVDYFGAPHRGASVGTFALRRLNPFVGSWPQALVSAPDGTPRALYTSGDGFNYLQPVDDEPVRVSGEVTGPNFGLPLGESVLVTASGVHVLGFEQLDGVLYGGREYVLLSRTESGWARTSVARAPRWECAPGTLEGDTCDVSSDQWRALSLVADADEPFVVLGRTVERGTLTWSCEEVCGFDTCGEDGGCCDRCAWAGDTAVSRELAIARAGGLETHTIELAIGEPRSLDATFGASGEVHLAIAERIEAEGLDCSMRYVRLQCGWGGER